MTENKELVKVSGFDLPISPKHAIELCSFIKGKEIIKVKNRLALVLEEKEIIPLKRFKHKRGHKKGIGGPGFYPKKASMHFLMLLNTLQSNAKNQGLDSDNLIVENAFTNRAAISWRGGTQSGRRTKRSHVTIFACLNKKEIKGKKK